MNKMCLKCFFQILYFYVRHGKLFNIFGQVNTMGLKCLITLYIEFTMLSVHNLNGKIRTTEFH